MTQTHCAHPGILHVIPGSRIIQFCGDADLAGIAFRQYGDLITACNDDGPHALRVDPAFDFPTIVRTVETQLRSLRLREWVVGA